MNQCMQVLNECNKLIAEFSKIPTNNQKANVSVLELDLVVPCMYSHWRKIRKRRSKISLMTWLRDSKRPLSKSKRRNSCSSIWLPIVTRSIATTKTTSAQLPRWQSRKSLSNLLQRLITWKRLLSNARRRSLKSNQLCKISTRSLKTSMWRCRTREKSWCASTSTWSPLQTT